MFTTIIVVAIAIAAYLVWKRHGSKVIDARDQVKNKADAIKDVLKN